MAAKSFHLVHQMMIFVIVYHLSRRHYICVSARNMHNSNHFQRNPNPTRSSNVPISPVLNSTTYLRNHYISPFKARAEVNIVAPTKLRKTTDPQQELIRANAIVMDFDEDTRKYLGSKSQSIGNQHQVRHQHRLLPPDVLSDDYYRATNDKTFADSPTNFDISLKSSDKIGPKKKRVPVKTLVYNDAQSEFSHSKKVSHEVNRNVKRLQNDSWISLSSPVRVHIPVRNDDLLYANKKCVQCSNITVIAARATTEVEISIPVMSICSRLSRQGGIINIAVTSGPQQGEKISEGQYPIELILWKGKGDIYSCKYTLVVKVNKCDAIHAPKFGSVECTNENVWGSECTFKCLHGYTLVGITTLVCDGSVKNVAWSALFPLCRTGKENKHPKRHTCIKPRPPVHGTVVCDSNEKDKYPAGSVCQFFCYPGFLIGGSSTSSTLTVCKNGHWTPSSEVSCLATYCTLPAVLDNTVITCDTKIPRKIDSKTKFRNGTRCQLHCKNGFAIPKSMQTKVIQCNAPVWNVRVIPECQEITLPKPYQSDCDNAVLVANHKGFVKVQSPKFILTRRSGEILRHANCTHVGKIAPGSYINHCSVYDEEFDVWGDCTYSIKVKENCCLSPPPVPHSTISCDSNSDEDSYARNTTCKYVCDEGFVIPRKHKRLKTKHCSHKLKWRPKGVPECHAAFQPVPKKKHCTDKIYFLEEFSPFVKIKRPKFKSSMPGSKVKVKCSLNSTLPAGHFINQCEAYDTQLELSATCKYNVIVRAQGCTKVPELSAGIINCTHTPKDGLYPAGTSCTYNCLEDYVVPLSLRSNTKKVCGDDSEWHPSLSPDCIAEVAPIAKVDSCISQTVLVEDLQTFRVPEPKFESIIGSILNIQCRPNKTSTYGSLNVSCTAYDPEVDMTGECTYLLEVKDPSNAAALSNSAKECDVLLPPEKGSLECSIHGSTTKCKASCEPGYTFSSEFRKLQSGSIECDTANGIWDFQEMHNISKLPDCLGHLPNTSVKVWIGFKAEVKDCEVSEKSIDQRTIGDALTYLNLNVCSVVDCESSLNTTCLKDPKSNAFILHVNWTLETVYVPKDDDSVPDFEIQFETIMTDTQKAISLDSKFKDDLRAHGIDILADSYDKGLILLICNKSGYGADIWTNKCVECPINMMEQDSRCISCPPGLFQTKSGQTFCES